MNLYEKKVADAKKKHGEYWHEHQSEYVWLTIDQDQAQAIVLEILIEAPFDEEQTFGKTYFTNGSFHSCDWEEDNPNITLADLSEWQIMKAKEMWKLL